MQRCNLRCGTGFAHRGSPLVVTPIEKQVLKRTARTREAHHICKITCRSPPGKASRVARAQRNFGLLTSVLLERCRPGGETGGETGSTQLSHVLKYTLPGKHLSGADQRRPRAITIAAQGRAAMPSTLHLLHPDETICDKRRGGRNQITVLFPSCIVLPVSAPLDHDLGGPARC